MTESAKTAHTDSPAKRTSRISTGMDVAWRSISPLTTVLISSIISAQQRKGTNRNEQVSLYAALHKQPSGRLGEEPDGCCGADCLFAGEVYREEERRIQHQDIR